MALLYAQARARRQLHLIEVSDPSLSGRLQLSTTALCGRKPTRDGGTWRMTINVPLGHACKDCLRKAAR